MLTPSRTFNALATATAILFVLGVTFARGQGFTLGPGETAVIELRCDFASSRCEQTAIKKIPAETKSRARRRVYQFRNFEEPEQWRRENRR